MIYALTPEQLTFYDQQGFVSPLPVFNDDEVAELRSKFE